ncbi:MAG: hypothetical protein AABZ55_09780 [Bdellovibrionota bacterium]
MVRFAFADDLQNLLGQPSRQISSEEPIYHDEYFDTQEYFSNLSYGASLGIRALGHFGQSDTLLAPRGGFAVEPSGFVWFKHAAQVRAALGFAMSDPHFLYGSLGGRATILEVIADSRSELKGIQGGLILQALDSFMIFASLDLNLIHFPLDPAKPLAFNGTAMVPSFGAGIQASVYRGTQDVQNGFIDLSISFMSIQGAKYLSPQISVGVELK